MLIPNKKCRIHTSSGQYDLNGRPVQGQIVGEMCAVVRMLTRAEKTSVRADTSASRGAAIEEVSDGKFLLMPRTVADYDDLIEVDGQKFKIVGKQRRYDINGRLDHYEIFGESWE